MIFKDNFHAKIFLDFMDKNDYFVSVCVLRSIFKFNFWRENLNILLIYSFEAPHIFSVKIQISDWQSFLTK